MKAQSRMAMYGLALLCSLSAAVAGANERGDRFKSMDADGDGMVSASEHAAAVKKMFGEMDANGDGKVTAAEMDAMHGMRGMQGMHGMKSGSRSDSGKAMGHAMSSSEKIAKMDTNGDGMMSASEHDSGAQAMFAQMDTDGNGSLSRQEMAAGHAMMKPDKPDKPDVPEQPGKTDLP